MRLFVKLGCVVVVFVKGLKRPLNACIVEKGAFRCVMIYYERQNGQQARLRS